MEKLSSLSQFERSGSVIIEEILNQEDTMLPIMPSVGLKEIMMTGCWYLWWIRRRVTHNEQIPPVTRWHTFVLAITSNHKRTLDCVKLNVDKT